MEMNELLLYDVDVFKANARLVWCGKDRFNITHLDAVVKGGAAGALKKVCYNADVLGVTLTLNAVPLITDLYPTRWGYQKLVEWYSRFGFKREPIDHPFILNFMIRIPITSPAIKPVLARV